MLRKFCECTHLSEVLAKTKIDDRCFFFLHLTGNLDSMCLKCVVVVDCLQHLLILRYISLCCLRFSYIILLFFGDAMEGLQYLEYELDMAKDTSRFGFELNMGYYCL
jgi:hypothetical protein